MSDLVKRLREEAAVQMDLAHDCDCPPECTSNWDAAKTLNEAAARIEALEDENAALNETIENTYDDINKANHELSAAEARAERLRAALKSITLSYEERCGIDHATLARSALENDQ